MKTVIIIVILVAVSQIGRALFGTAFEADNKMVEDTVQLQVNVSNALSCAFNDFGRLEVRSDYSLHAYIAKRNYMLVPYPDRDLAISTVGKAWCENEVFPHWYMPKVILRDIQTGEDLGSYRCIFKSVSKK